MRRGLLLCLLCAAVFADSWIAFGDKRFASPDGKRTLVVRQDRSFEFGSVKGTLPQLPWKVSVLNGRAGRAGAVLLEKYGNLGFGDAVALLGADGKLRWRVALKALFDGKIRGTFKQSISSIWWHRAWWVDEARGKVVIVAQGGHVREVDLATGAVSISKKGVVATGIAIPHARKLALELAAELSVPEARALAEKLAADDTTTADIRLRAAIVAQGAGGKKVEAELFLAALGKKQAIGDRKWAIQQAPAILGDKALDLLEQAATSRETAYEAIGALAKMGQAGARRLASVIAAGDTTKSARNYASQTLGELGSDAVGKAIAAELADADAWVAGALLNAGIAARVPNLHKIAHPHEEVLISVLERDSAPVEWLADHFTKLPSTEAVRPLVKALSRHARSPNRKKKLIAALKACTGLDYGNSVAAWQKALRRR